MIFRKQIFLILLPLAAAGCMRGGDHVILPAHHPAEPGARPGIPPGESTALEPELRTVSVETGGQMREAPSSPAGQHQHHQH